MKNIKNFLVLLFIIVFANSLFAGNPMVSTGYKHTIALKDDGKVLSWGNNTSGQLGTNSSANSPTAVYVRDHLGNMISDIKYISTNYNHSVALRDDGTVFAWGENVFGQLGNGTNTNTNHATIVADNFGFSIINIATVEAGKYHTVALKTDGTLLSWGKNSSGQLGIGTNADTYVPTAVRDLGGSILSNISKIAVGAEHTLALSDDGRVYSWGHNYYGQLGDGTTTKRNYPALVQDSNNNTLSNVESIYAGSNYSIAVKSDGTVWTWGHNSSGQLGDGTQTNQALAKQVTGSEEFSFTNIDMIASGHLHNIILRTDNTLITWGDNSSGQLGSGNTDSSIVPIEIKDSSDNILIDIRYVSSNYKHAMALKTDGTILAWGENSDSQLGIGTTTDTTTPTLVIDEEGLNVKLFDVSPEEEIIEEEEDPIPPCADQLVSGTMVATGDRHSLALAIDGTVWSWGDNISGQLGNLTTLNSNIPAKVKDVNDTPITGIKYISTKYRHSLAVRTDGTMLAWGENVFGQLGNGTTANTNHATSVVDANGSLVTDIAKVMVGQYHSLALTTSGRLLSWGKNSSGELGDGTRADKIAPVNVIDSSGNILSGITSVAVGNNHTIALTIDGTVYGWGNNYYGQLGDGTSTNVITPKLLRDANSSIITDVRSIHAGYRYSIIIKTDGTILMFGHNSSGQLGDGTQTDQHLPVQIYGSEDYPLQNIVSMDGGHLHTAVLRIDGSIITWGNNGAGELGDGTLTNSIVPVMVKDANLESLYQIKSISTSYKHTLALKIDGTILAWGENTYGQLGNATNINSSKAINVIDEEGENIQLFDIYENASICEDPDNPEEPTPDEGEEPTPDEGEEPNPDEGEEPNPDEGEEPNPDEGEEVPLTPAQLYCKRNPTMCLYTDLIPAAQYIEDNNLSEDGENILTALEVKDYDTVDTLYPNYKANHFPAKNGITPLHIYIKKKEVALAKELIDNGANVNAQDIKKGETPLHQAITSKQYELISYLLQNGANPHLAEYKKGYTPIMYAVYKADPLALQAFIDGGYDIDTIDENGISAIHYATELKKMSKLAEFFISSGANLNLENDKGQTIAHLLIGLKDTKNLELLAPAGLDLTKVDNDGHNLLNYYYFSKSPQKKIKEFLDLNNITTLAPFANGQTLLHIYGEYGNSKAILENIDIDINAKDDFGRTVLHYVAQTGDTKSIEFLIESGANINELDNDGNTPLILAAIASKKFANIKEIFLKAKMNGKKSVALLIELGADVSIVNNDSKIALHYIVDSGDKKSIELLVDAGSDIEAVDSYGNTPLLLSATTDTGIKSVKVLIAKGANMLAVNSENQNIAHIASGAWVEDITIYDKKGLTKVYKTYGALKEYFTLYSFELLVKITLFDNIDFNL
jgi:alpha-tubulin suppressor-like RCC1 family protein/ankyrin repeat protein